MSNLTIFQFKDREVRFIEGKPVAKDVAIVLGFKNAADAVYRLVDKVYKGICKAQTPGGMQDITVLEEPGIYQLIFSSKLESAKEFQQWVFADILPTIRKTGGYGKTFDPSSLSRLDILTLALKSEKAYLAEKEARQIAEQKVEILKEDVKELRTTLIEKEPLVQLAETLIVHDKDVVTISEFAKAMKIGRNKMFENLYKINFLQKDGRTPYQIHINAGRAEVYRKQRAHQPGMYDTVTVLTAKGQEYISKKLVELNRLEIVEVQMEGQLTADDF